jgi:hypothetical protein
MYQDVAIRFPGHEFATMTFGQGDNFLKRKTRPMLPHELIGLPRLKNQPRLLGRSRAEFKSVFVWPINLSLERWA